jgi:hypothetical protein
MADQPCPFCDRPLLYDVDEKRWYCPNAWRHEKVTEWDGLTDAEAAAEEATWD